MANNYSRKTREILKEAGVIKNPKDAEGREMELIKEVRQERQIKLLSAQNKLFMEEWLKSGNAIGAYKKAYKIKSDVRAVERSAVLISRYRENVLMAMREKMGINEQLYFTRLMALLKAKKVIFTKFGGKHVIPDNQARVKALQMLGDLLKLHYTSTGVGNTIQNAIGQVNIYKDKDKGLFTVADSSPILEMP